VNIQTTLATETEQIVNFVTRNFRCKDIEQQQHKNNAEASHDMPVGGGLSSRSDHRCGAGVYVLQLHF